MYTRGDRQFSRGGVSTNQRPDPANRHRRRFHRYVRRRNHSGGGNGGSYGRGGSFSDDRNDSSSPPIQINRHQANSNDEPQQQQQPPPSSASPYVQQQSSYPQQPQQQSSKVQHRSSHRGSRKSHYDSRHSRNDPPKQERPFYDNTSMYLSSRNQQSSRNAYADGSDNDYNENAGSVDQQQQQHHHHQQQPQHQQQQQQNHGYSNRKIDELTKSFHAQKAEIDDMKLTLSKLTLELDQVKSRIKESESNVNNIGATNSKVTTNNNQQSVGGGDLDDKPNKLAINRRKIRVKREKRTAKLVEKRATNNISKPIASQQEKQKQILNPDTKQTAASPAAGNSDKQTEPSTNNHPGRYHERRRMKKAALKTKSFPELTESELNEVVQNLKREFVNLERPIKSIKNTMNDKGPKVVYEFAVSILDHAICDVTSPTKLSEISNNLYQLIVSKDNTSEVDFQQGFYDALKDISKREDDIAIDAPRYLDTLGQVLADCIVPMNGKYSNLMRKFLNRSLDSYDQKNRGALLANIMKGIAGIKSERFAKQVFDNAQLNWNNILMPETDLKEFLESHCVAFLARAFSPETRGSEKAPKELEKFADDITDLVEKKSTAQSLDDFVKDLHFPEEDRVEHLGTLIYAIVRGCIITDSGSYKLDKQALKEYSSILSEKHDQQDAIALHALTALTILWHSYNCPKDLFLQMLVALHSYGTASNEALVEWLNSENLTNIPGIGAARCGDSKRYIEQLVANQKK